MPYLPFQLFILLIPQSKSVSAKKNILMNPHRCFQDEVIFRLRYVIIYIYYFRDNASIVDVNLIKSDSASFYVHTSFSLTNLINRIRRIRACHIALPAHTRLWTNVVLMLAQRRRRWANIKTTLVQSLVCVGKGIETGAWYKKQYLLLVKKRLHTPQTASTN